MRSWILSAEMRTRSLGSVMKLTLSAKLEARAERTDVDVGAGSFAGDGLPEGEVGDMFFDQVLEKPPALGLVGVDGHVDAAAMVEAERTMHGGFAHGADRE